VNTLIAWFFIVSMIGLFVFAGCAGTQNSSKPGAQLWGENCGRCHNVRPPASLTDEEWEVAGLHMRTRANLTGDDAAKIVEFLQMAN